MYENITTELVDEKTLIISINRPDKLNALNRATLHELKNAFIEAKSTEQVKGVILTGTGEKAFVAGADINEFANIDSANAYELSKEGQDFFDDIESFPKPVLAAVNGFALGGGCELAMACHMRIASDNAQFAQPEINLGIIPGYGGTQRLTFLVGKGKAIELMLTGDMVDATEAHRLGLVNHVFPHERLMTECRKLISVIAQKPPIAVKQVIQSANSAHGIEDGYAIEVAGFVKCASSEDFKEGTAAFLEKRKPEFKGE